MARIRTIKPEFPQSESMGRVSRNARLLFVLLWTLCDDSGRTRGNSRMLASLLFPYDDDAPSLIDGWLDELEKEGCVVRYLAEGSTYIEVCNWLNHQKIDKPSQSKIPPFSESSRILANPREHSCVDQGSKDQGSKDQGSKDQGERQEPPSSQATPPPAKKSKEKGTRLSPDWLLPRNWAEWALKEFPVLHAEDIRLEADKFRDYWISVGGAKGVKLDWGATWRNWIRRVVEDRKGGKPSNGYNDSLVAAGKAIFGDLSHGNANIIEGETNEVERLPDFQAVL